MNNSDVMVSVVTTSRRDEPLRKIHYHNSSIQAGPNVTWPSFLIAVKNKRATFLCYLYFRPFFFCPYKFCIFVSCSKKYIHYFHGIVICPRVS